MSDWLWDGRGEPDEAERRLADSLRPLDHDPGLPVLPPRRPRRALAVGALLAAAALALVVLRLDRGWVVRADAGPCATGTCRLRPGDSLRSGPGEHLTVAMEQGELSLNEVSVLRRLDGEARLALDAGELHLSWHGAPGVVQIETPAASLTDLGCAFAVRVDEGGTLLTVEDGTIQLRNAEGSSFVTGGSSARARPGVAPSPPLRGDAPAALWALVDGTGPLEPALAEARPVDLLTLWDLMARVPEAQRPAVYAAMRRHVPTLPETPAPALLALDDAARTALWQALVPTALPIREK